MEQEFMNYDVAIIGTGIIGTQHGVKRRWPR